jgi:prevent-host-death family protein
MNTKIKWKVSEFSITEARRNFPSLVRKAEDGGAVRITRRGKPVALLIGRREFERLVSDRRDFVEAHEEFSKSHDLEDLNIDPDEVFCNSRDESAGRDVSL